MKKLTQAQIAQKLGISKSYLSMVLNGQRNATPELISRLESIPGVHNFVNNQLQGLLHTQGVTGSSPVPPTLPQSLLLKEFFHGIVNNAENIYNEIVQVHPTLPK